MATTLQGPGPSRLCGQGSPKRDWLVTEYISPCPLHGWNNRRTIAQTRDDNFQAIRENESFYRTRSNVPSLIILQGNVLFPAKCFISRIHPHPTGKIFFSRWRKDFFSQERLYFPLPIPRTTLDYRVVLMGIMTYLKSSRPTGLTTPGLDDPFVSRAICSSGMTLSTSIR